MPAYRLEISGPPSRGVNADGRGTEDIGIRICYRWNRLPRRSQAVSDRASVLRAALQRRKALVVPGCHDALSAKIVERAGFEAVQVSGFGLAGSLLGKPDVGLVDMQDILDFTGYITRAVSILSLIHISEPTRLGMI